MKTLAKQKQKLAAKVIPTLLVAAAFAFSSSPAQARPEKAGKVVQPDEAYRGKTYSQWSASWWQWNLGLPVAGHPSSDSPDFDVTDGQQGNVWFLAGPFDTHERFITIPSGTALFIGTLTVECSSLETPESGFHGDTEAEQRECANFYGDHIVNVTCTVDGEAVENIGDFRVGSPQYEFDAPTPWIFGETGGHGTSVADGYYVLVKALAKGTHTIHYSGAFHFTLAEDGFDADLPVDMTYHVTVE